MCLAVPVKHREGEICAVVALHGPAPRMTLKKGYGFLSAMKDAAAAIAATLTPVSAANTQAPLRRVDLNRKDQAA